MKALGCLLLSICSVSCAGFPLRSLTVHALADQSDLKVAESAREQLCRVLFTPSGYTLDGIARKELLEKVGPASERTLLLVGAASADLPAEHARVLSQRRAESVRQALISAGWDSASLHSTALGHDGPAARDLNEVRVFRFDTEE